MRLKVTQLNSISVFVVALLLCACGGNKNRFCLKGEIKHLRDGQFYVCSDTRFDTVWVKKGEFRYTADLAAAEVMTLLFSNFQQLPVVARPGLTLKAKADAKNFFTTKITGNDENEALSRFMQDNGGLPAPKMRQAAAAFIRRHPGYTASVALLNTCFVETTSQPSADAAPLLQLLLKSQPRSPLLLRTAQRLRPILATAKGQRLPKFKATTVDGKTVSDSLFSHKPLLVTFWAEWQPESYSQARRVKGFVRRYGGRLAALNVSLNANRSQCLRTIGRDSIAGYNVCDTRGFASPIALAFGVRYLPSVVLVGSDGKILGRDLTDTEIQRQLDTIIK